MSFCFSSTLYHVESGSGKDLFDLETDYNKNLPPGKILPNFMINIYEKVLGV